MRFWNILWGEMRRYWRPFTLIVMAAMLLMWSVIFEKDRVSVRPGTNSGIAMTFRWNTQSDSARI